MTVAALAAFTMGSCVATGGCLFDRTSSLDSVFENGAPGAGGSGGQKISGGEGGALIPCGNGVVEEGEECDDGNQDDLDGCLTSCKKASCGDGFVRSGGSDAESEQCDDGNLDSGDGCSSSCQREPGACCKGAQPSQCSLGPHSLLAEDLDITIPNNGMEASPNEQACHTLQFDLGRCGLISDVDITVGIHSGRVGGLYATVTHPADENEQVLLEYPGLPDISDGFDANLRPNHPITFDDQAAVSAELMGQDLASNEAVCRLDEVCDYAPHPGSLDAFTKVSPDGSWKFCVGDRLGGGNMDRLDDVAFVITTE